MEVVLVDWVDALSRDEWSANLKDMPTIVPCQTAGFLLKHDEKEVVLALNWLDGGGQHEATSCAIAIPTGCVLSVRKLKLSKSS